MAYRRSSGWKTRAAEVIESTIRGRESTDLPITLVIWIARDITGTIGDVPTKFCFARFLTLSKDNSRPISFPLRLPFSTRRQAIEIAQREGLSLNQFISLAVAEKITRLEHIAWPEHVSGNSMLAVLSNKER